MVDLRKDKRAPASLKVKYKSATVDQFIDQFGTDVSRGGIFIKTKKPIEIGALLKLELQLTDASPVIHGIGRVCWRRENAPDPNVPAGMGIKFVKLDPESRTIVERIVQNRGERPSRFEQTQGAEIAAASEPPPAASVPPPVIKAPAPAAPKPMAAKPAPAAPIKAPAPTGFVAAATAKPAGPPIKPPSAGARAVAGLFADSPIARSAAPEVGGETGGRSSFFPPAPASSGGSSPALRGGASNNGASSKPPSRPPTGRSEQARQSGQFLAAAFAEGGLAEDTTAQARAVADAGTDELLDELFDEVVKTNEHPALPPRNSEPMAPPLARASNPGAAPATVDDMFAALNEEENFTDAPPAPPRSAPPRFPSARAERGSSPGPARTSSPGAVRASDTGSSSFGFEERTTERTSVDDLFGSAASAPTQPTTPRPAPPAAADERDYEGEFDSGDAGPGFGEADLFADSAIKSSLPPAPRIASDAPLAPSDYASLQSSSSKLPLIVLIVLVLLGAGGFFYYTKVMQPNAARSAAAARAAEPAPSAPPPAAEPAAAGAAGAAAPGEQPAAAAEPAAAPAAAPAAPSKPSAATEQPSTASAHSAPASGTPSAAPAAANASVEIEISSLPRGADITVSGKMVGNTPVRVPFTIGKSAEVRVSTPGYAAMTQTVVATTNSEPLRFKLEPLPYALIVRSTPPGADVSVGQRSASAPAPLDLGHLDGGVQVSIAKDGYQRMTRLVRLDEFTEQAGVMRAVIEATLSPLPGGSPPSQRPHASGRASRPRGAEGAPPAPSEEPAPEAAPEVAPKPAAEAAPPEP